VVVVRLVHSAPRHDSLLDVWTLRRIGMPWIATNGNRLVGGVRILVGLSHGGSVHVVVVLDFHLGVVLVDGRKGVMVLLTARGSRDNW